MKQYYLDEKLDIVIYQDKMNLLFPSSLNWASDNSRPITHEDAKITLNMKMQKKELWI